MDRTHHQFDLRTPALEAISAAGGGAKLAREIGVTRFAVQQWKSRGIPAARAREVAKVSGIPAHVLRPDFFEAAV